MSFSEEVKQELCRVPLQRMCCIRAEAYGALLHASAFSYREIRLSTRRAEIAERLKTILQLVFSVSCEPQTVGNRLQFLLPQDAINRIFDALGYDRKNHVSYHINRNIIEEDCCAAAYLRGAFLLAGALAGPDKKNHLEIRSLRHNLSGEETSLLLDLGLSPKQARRGNAYVLYFKDGDSIASLLSQLGAPGAVQKQMQAKAEKKLHNAINRQVNCETANLVKSVNTAARQTNAIRAVLQKSGMETFPPYLQETVRLRLSYPDDSLTELAARFNPPLSKPGLSHRLKKIMKCAELAAIRKLS